ncbi:SGNH/GDSL hydrolase family protein [Flavobacterium adhaerens]|uniref:SGNH/GDSL hydrolase family protein n=1 Tax=Flavobacterium adhaerens TaxID=3149043 RepID=UPI0032B3B13E
MIKNFKWLLLASLSFVACDNNDDEDSNQVEVPVTSGSASFTKYVALGDSFAAGYSDSALFKAGQENSYVNILAQQFVAAGGGDFKTPMMADNIGGLLLNGNVIAGPRLAILGLSVAGSPIVGSVSGVPTTEVLDHQVGPFNNLGVPGAKSYHLVAPGYGSVAGVVSGKSNPYFARFATSATTTVLADALVQAPTFFSLFIGGNDVLTYATSGGVGVDQTGNLDPSTYGTNDITDPNVFASVYSSLVTNLTANGAKGVVANLPYITTLPYFTTVPYNPVPLDATTADQLNAGYAQYNAGLQAMVQNKLLSAEEATQRTIKFTAGNNAVVIVDSYLTDLSAYKLPSYRQVTKEDLVVLTARTFIGTTVGGDATKINGVSVPLADQWILTKEEVKSVMVATDAYNKTIASIAEAKGLAVADTKTAMEQLALTGIRFGNYQMTASYATGGAFSLDGIHPTPRGYAFIANLFIKAINAKFGATVKDVDLAQYQSLFPASMQ